MTHEKFKLQSRLGRRWVRKGEKWREGEGKGECVSQLKKDGKDVNFKPQCVMEIYFMSISLKITS